jgi:hypothetical protein
MKTHEMQQVRLFTNVANLSRFPKVKQVQAIFVLVITYHANYQFDNFYLVEGLGDIF